VATVGIGIVIFATFMLPRFKIFDGQVPLPMATRILIGISDVFTATRLMILIITTVASSNASSPPEVRRIDAGR
jgi:type II secretory pathway component PulF